jgi:hypothetical protein
MAEPQPQPCCPRPRRKNLHKLDFHHANLLDRSHSCTSIPIYTKPSRILPSQITHDHLRQTPAVLELLPHPRWTPPLHAPASTNYHQKSLKVPNIFKDQSTKDQYQANMQEWFNTHPCPTVPLLIPGSASTYLQQVSEESTNNTNGSTRKWRSYHDGWSPFMLANQAHYHFHFKVQRHLIGQHGYSKQSPPQILPNIWSHTFTWEEAIHRVFCGDKDPEAVRQYIATLPQSPTYYHNLAAAPMKEFVASEISKTRNRNQTRRTQEKANNLTEYRQMLSATFEEKQ